MLIAQTEAMADDLVDRFGFPETKIRVLPNPIVLERLSSAPDMAVPVFDIIAVGSLSKIKGHSRLIKAVAELENRVTLKIIGDGLERKRLEQLVQELNLGNRLSSWASDRISSNLEKSESFCSSILL